MKVTASATCAVLYAMGSLVTGQIRSPWGAGQFRPAVFIPAVFATIFGPLAGGLGAALGTLIADSINRGQIYVRSIVSAVPANFIGFYLFGWFLNRRFTWTRYVRISQLAILVSNTVLAFLYVPFRVFVDASFPETFKQAWVPLSLGFLAWWYITGMPFVLLLGPPIIRAIAVAFPGITSQEIKLSSIRDEIPGRSFAAALMVPGLLMLMIGVATVYADPEFMIDTGLASSRLVLSGLQIMFLLSGAILLILGLAMLVFKMVEDKK